MGLSECFAKTPLHVLENDEFSLFNLPYLVGTYLKPTPQDLDDVKFRSFTGNFLEDSPKNHGFMMDFHRQGARSLGICPNEMDTIGWSLVVP